MAAGRFNLQFKHYLMIAPFFILFVIFYLAPILFGFGISLTDWDSIHQPTFVGLDNYRAVIQSPAAVKAFSNLFLYVALTMPIGIGMAFIIAMVVNRFTGVVATILRSAYFLPTVIPLFLVATIWRWLLTPDFGIVNLLLERVGVQSVNWLQDPRYMIPGLVMADVWRATGFNMVLLLAGMKNIPEEYYDAARVDGANSWRIVRHITIPLLEPVLFLVIVNGFINALQVFDIPWLMSGSSYTSYGGPLRGMLFPVMDIVGRAFGRLKFGEASAYSFLLFAVILLISIAQLVIRQRHQMES